MKIHVAVTERGWVIAASLSAAQVKRVLRNDGYSFAENDRENTRAVWCNRESASQRPPLAYLSAVRTVGLL